MVLPFLTYGITTIHYDKPPRPMYLTSEIRKRESITRTQNFTLSDNERQKRILPYLKFYAQYRPSQEQIYDPTTFYKKRPEIRYVLPMKIPNNQRLTQKSQQPISYNPHQTAFTPFLESNALPGPFIPIIQNQHRQQQQLQQMRPPNFSEIYDKLAQLKFLQPIQTQEAHPPDPLQITKLQGYVDRGSQTFYVTPPQKMTDSRVNRPKIPTLVHTYTPSNIDLPLSIRPKLKETYENSPVPSIDIPNNKYHTPAAYYGVLKQKGYNVPKEIILAHNNKQFFYEHPVQPARVSQAVLQENQYRNKNVPVQLFDQKSYLVNSEGPVIHLPNEVKPLKFETVTKYQSQNPIRFQPSPELPPISQHLYKFQSSPEMVIQKYAENYQKLGGFIISMPESQETTNLEQTQKPQKDYHMSNNQISTPLQLIENISQNTMNHFQTTPVSSVSTPSLHENIQNTIGSSTLTSPSTPELREPIPSEDQKPPSTEVVRYSQESEQYLPQIPNIGKTKPAAVFVPQTETTLSNVLKKLQDSNTLPKTLTADNIDNSIKTLVYILSSLKKQKKLLQPLVIPDNIREYESDSENEAEGPVVTETFPADTPEGGTPGRPGIDYPTLYNIPPTSFDCKTQRYKGFFADPETQCQVWHYCDLNGGQASFLCPNGTIFSQVALTCDWWFNVKCANTPQLYVLNERLYKYIIPLTPKFPEDYSGPLVDRYLALKFKEMEEKMKKEKKGKKPAEKDKEQDGSETSQEDTKSEGENSTEEVSNKEESTSTMDTPNVLEVDP